MNKKYNRRKKFYRKSNRRKSKKRKNRKKTNRKRNLRGGMLGTEARGREMVVVPPAPLGETQGADVPEPPGVDLPDEPPGVDLPDETPPGDATPDSYTEWIERCRLAPTIQALGIITSEDLSIEDNIIVVIRRIVIQRLETMRVRQERTKKTDEAEHPAAFTPIGGQAPAQAMSPVTLSSDIRVGPGDKEWSQITFITHFFPGWEEALPVSGRTSPIAVPIADWDLGVRSGFISDVKTILKNISGVDIGEAPDKPVVAGALISGQYTTWIGKSNAKKRLTKGLEDLIKYVEYIPETYIRRWIARGRPGMFLSYMRKLDIDEMGKRNPE